MLVVGIDPGTAITGFGFVRETVEGSLEVVEYGVIQTPAGLSQADRLNLLFEALNDKLLFHQPVSAAVEKLFFQRNVRTAIAVGQARGVALLALARHGLEVAEYSPLEVKQAVVGYGGADKYQVQQMVRALLNLPAIPHPDDAADALAVAICHIHSNRIKHFSRV